MELLQLSWQLIMAVIIISMYHRVILEIIVGLMLALLSPI